MPPHNSMSPNCSLKLIKGSDEIDSFARQLSFLRGVISLEGHIDIETKGQKAEQRFPWSRRASASRHERPKNQQMKRGLEVLGVVDGADTGNESEEKSGFRAAASCRLRRAAEWAGWRLPAVPALSPRLSAKQLSQ